MKKSKMFEVFKKFKMMVKKETCKHIKVVRSTKGGLFTSTKLVKCCEEELDIRRFLHSHTHHNRMV